MLKHDNAMRRQVFSLPELIKQQYEDLEPKTRKVLSTPEIFSIQKIVLTGCGDSFAAVMATKHAFEMLTGIPTEVVSTIELSRLYAAKQLGFAPNNPLVIAVSNSGGVARIGEAVQRANKYGAFTLGVTGNRESILGKNAKRILDLNIPTFESAPGTRSYMCAMMSLLLLAIRIGEVRGSYTMDQAMDYRYDIHNQGDKLAEALSEMDEVALETAKRWQNLEAYDFIGSGFDYATAWFGHAKIFEAVGKYAMRINYEEWMHLNLFIRNAEEIGTIMIANTENPAFSRAKEVAGFCNKLQRPLMIITDGDEKDFGADAIYIKTPKPKYPITMPLTQFVPISLLAGYISEMIGEEDGRGCSGRWEFCQGGAGVKNSEVIIK